MRFLLPFVVLVAASLAGAATWQEDFTQAPTTPEWHIHGDNTLFNWNATNQNLEVTWDSSRSNSYFLRPLGTIVARSDDFSFEFDLQLTEIAIGVNSNKPVTFPLALGLLNFTSATDTNLQIGTGVNPGHGPRNLVEFDYFADSGFGATVATVMVSSNNYPFAFAHSYPFELDPGAWFHVLMSYTASNRTLHTSMTRNGSPFGPIKSLILAENYTDFRVDHFAISSYSEAGSDGSLLAHGVVDNIVVTVPNPPTTNLTGGFSNQIWQVSFQSQSNWVYALERTTDWRNWMGVTTEFAGTDAVLVLQDSNPPTARALYRVRANRP